MSTEGKTKKIDDLRVVDLRAELEKRGLDKSGVKAVLTDRLRKVREEKNSREKRGLTRHVAQHGVLLLSSLFVHSLLFPLDSSPMDVLVVSSGSTTVWISSE